MSCACGRRSIGKVRADNSWSRSHPVTSCGDTDEVDHFQLWPHREGTDAMFAATLRRRPLA